MLSTLQQRPAAGGTAEPLADRYHDPHALGGNEGTRIA
jgi:hypothetical protein